MTFHINYDNGHIAAGPLNIAWGNALVDLGLTGFFALSWGSWALEMGDIDQGRSGIYLTRYVQGEPYPAATLWQA